MANSAESEAKGLPTIGNPDVTYRTSDRGPTGETSIGSKIWGSVMVRGNPDKLRQGMVIYNSSPQLRGAGSR